jgi:hypothetical protein
MKKVLLGLLGIVVLVVGGAAVFLATKSPAQRPPDPTPSASTPDLVKRGEYQVEHVAFCTHCHSDPQTDRWAMPEKAGSKASGGFCWDDKMHFPGKMCAANITPDRDTGLGAWSDGEILRAMREGVDRKGAALFPLMPYLNYAKMSDNDAKSVIAYLRTLAPVSRARPERELKPPLNIIVKFMPKPLEGSVPEPDRADRTAYGKYLVKIGSCETCHTPVNEKHEPLPGMAFAGGQEFLFPWGGSVRSSNLTPHETGLGGRTKEAFIALFKSFTDPAVANVPVSPRENTVMPWLKIAGMTEEDLGAIYDYLRTVPSVANSVEKRPAPTAPAPTPHEAAAATAPAEGATTATAPAAGAAAK